jgi:hypothetical protein
LRVGVFALAWSKSPGVEYSDVVAKTTVPVVDRVTAAI